MIAFANHGQETRALSLRLTRRTVSGRANPLLRAASAVLLVFVSWVLVPTCVAGWALGYTQQSPYLTHEYRLQRARRKTALRAAKYERPKKMGGEPWRKKLDLFKVGQKIKGRVIQIYYPGGVSVDIGAECLGFLEVEEFRDGAPEDGYFTFKPGDNLTVRILDIDPSYQREDHGEPDPFGEHGNTGKLHLTLRSGSLERPPRYVAKGVANIVPFTSMPHDEWLEGEITCMASWAVYLKVNAPDGTPFVGILDRDDFREGFEDEAIRGGTYKVRIKDVDTECRRLLLTMKDL